MSELSKVRHLVTPIGEVTTKPPEWVLPGLFPPGLTIIAGPPKSKKSTLVLAALTYLGLNTRGGLRGLPTVKGGSKMKPGKETSLIFPYEQTAGRLKHLVERRVLGKNVQKTSTVILFVNDAWQWQLDAPKGEHNVLSLTQTLKPAVVVIDPIRNAHTMEENDPAWVRLLVPLRQWALKTGKAVVIVHHTSKKKEGASSKDFDRLRGSSALWGLADAGHLLDKVGNTRVKVSSEFKDFEPMEWIWSPPQ